MPNTIFVFVKNIRLLSVDFLNPVNKVFSKGLHSDRNFVLEVIHLRCKRIQFQHLFKLFINLKSIISLRKWSAQLCIYSQILSHVLNWRNIINYFLYSSYSLYTSTSHKTVEKGKMPFPQYLLVQEYSCIN